MIAYVVAWTAIGWCSCGSTVGGDGSGVERVYGGLGSKGGSVYMGAAWLESHHVTEVLTEESFAVQASC